MSVHVAAGKVTFTLVGGDLRLAQEKEKNMNSVRACVSPLSKKTKKSGSVFVRRTLEEKG